jgi:transcriptional regulator with XRE-family HTH domain
VPEPASSFAARLGSNVRELRGHRGWTQRELAERAGLHPSAVGMVERGMRVPRADTAFRLGGALGVPLDKLFVGIAWVPRLSGAGEFVFPSRQEWQREVLRRAAAFRATQTEEVDAVELIRESREELERRTDRALGDA